MSPPGRTLNRTRVAERLLRNALAELDRRLSAAGRDRAHFSVTVYGAPQTEEALAEYESLGVERVLFTLRPEGRATVLTKLDRMAALL